MRLTQIRKMNHLHIIREYKDVILSHHHIHCQYIITYAAQIIILILLETCVVNITIMMISCYIRSISITQLPLNEINLIHNFIYKTNFFKYAINNVSLGY